MDLVSSERHLFFIGFILLNVGIITFLTNNQIASILCCLISLLFFSRLLSHALKGGEDNGESKLVHTPGDTTANTLSDTAA